MVTREELYDLVWSKPMTKVAEQFEVSGSYLARVCSVLRVPRPQRGYWAKLAVGKTMTKPPLPEAQPGDQVDWSKDGELPSPPPRPKPAVPRRADIPRLAKPVSGTHSLIQGAKAHFENSRRIEEGQHFKPYKKILVDVTASSSGLHKALAFANDLFNALESADHRVLLALESEQLRRAEVDKDEHPRKQRPHYYSPVWSPSRPTVVYIGTVAIGLAIVEMSEEVVMRYVGNGQYIRDADYVPPKASRRYVDHTWTTTRDIPSGRLRLIAYSPYWRVAWSENWQETKGDSLSSRIPKIIKAIQNATVELVERLQETDRQVEILRLKQLVEEERYRLEEDRRRVQQSIKDSQTQLFEVIKAWSDVMNVERFLQGVQDRAMDLRGDDRETVLERLKLARQFIGTQNPLDFFLSWKTPLERYQPLSSILPDGDSASLNSEQ